MSLIILFFFDRSKKLDSFPNGTIRLHYINGLAFEIRQEKNGLIFRWAPLWKEVRTAMVIEVPKEIEIRYRGFGMLYHFFLKKYSKYSHGYQNIVQV